MKLIIEIKKNPGDDGMCECVKVAVVEEDLFDIAEKKAITSGLLTKQEIFDFELLHIQP